MAARLTDKQKNKIIADYVECSSYNAVAKKNGVSATTVKNIIKAQNVDFVQKCEHKKEENASDILAYMDSKKDVVCDIIGLGLSVLRDPEKMKSATLSQITTALGTLIDKWAIVSGTPATDNREDALSKSLQELAEGMNDD